MVQRRTSPQKKARQIAKYLREEQPDYAYIRTVFYYLRKELKIEVPKKSKKLPYIPSESDIKKYYDAVWQTKRFQDMVIVRTLLYTGVRVSELVNIKLVDVDIDSCQIYISSGKGGVGRKVPFPKSFRELLARQLDDMLSKGATYLFESSRRHKYSERGIRRMLERYSKSAGLERNISPHQLRHFLFVWLKKQGVEDAFIQPFSGHVSRQSLEVYSRLTINEAQEVYDQVIDKFPI